MDLKGDNKKLYKLMAHLSGVRTDNPLPPHNSNESLANHFADYFLTKIDKIRDNFSQAPVFIPEAQIFQSFENSLPSLQSRLLN